DELQTAGKRRASREEDGDQLPVVGELPLDVVPERALRGDRGCEIGDDAAVVVKAEPFRAGERPTVGGLDELDRPVHRVARSHVVLVLLAVARDDERDSRRRAELETGRLAKMGDTRLDALYKQRVVLHPGARVHITAPAR